MRSFFLVFVAASLFGLAGCTVRTSSNDEDKDKNKNVDISTPWGSLKTRNAPSPDDAGLALYPGAERIPDSQSDSNAAVNIDTPVFSLKVVAMKYKSDDPPAKVLDFYRNDLKRYGSKVLECHPE